MVATTFEGEYQIKFNSYENRELRVCDTLFNCEIN